MVSIADRAVLVTGANRGIGRALTVSTRCRSDRPSRSSRHTTSASPAEVSVRGPVPCDVRPDRRFWLCTTRSALWPEEATGMPAVPGEAWHLSLLAACVLFMARTVAGRGRRRASTCRRWLPAVFRSG